MWPGPYGDFGSRKYLVASLNQSLERMGLEYVDIFYHHRPDPETPLEETMGALSSIVHGGKALYAGISMYPSELTRQAASLMRQMGTPLLIHQPNYSLFDRWVENGLLNTLEEEGIGCIVFSPLEQGILTDRYLKGIPSDSRAGKTGTYLSREDISEDELAKVRLLNNMAQERGQSMAQMALAWVLRQPSVTSALIGASKVSQVEDGVAALNNLSFSRQELDSIESILSGSD
jgi:L-glyceraldehyde 3-phosphate reductase